MSQGHWKEGKMEIKDKREARVRDDQWSPNLGDQEWGAGKYHFIQQ